MFPIKSEDEVPTRAARESDDAAMEPGGPRLYHLGNGCYVQSQGRGNPPQAVREYAANHGGESPPYFLLPTGPTAFRVTDLPNGRRIHWSGQGRLPKEVLSYVVGHGCFPPHD